MIKKIIATILTPLLTGCGIGQTFLYALSSPEPHFKNFPLGRQQKITINLEKSYIEKPYLIGLKTEFIGRTEMPSHEMYKKLNYPFKLHIKGYKKIGNQYQQISDNVITNKSISRDTQSDAQDVNNKAFIRSFNRMLLTGGQYRFEITDQSEFIEEYREIKTSIDIFVDTTIN